MLCCCSLVLCRMPRWISLSWRSTFNCAAVPGVSTDSDDNTHLSKPLNCHIPLITGKAVLQAQRARQRARRRARLRAAAAARRHLGCLGVPPRDCLPPPEPHLRRACRHRFRCVSGLRFRPACLTKCKSAVQQESQVLLSDVIHDGYIVTACSRNEMMTVWTGTASGWWRRRITPCTPTAAD